MKVEKGAMAKAVQDEARDRAKMDEIIKAESQEREAKMVMQRKMEAGQAKLQEEEVSLKKSKYHSSARLFESQA